MSLKEFASNSGDAIADLAEEASAAVDQFAVLELAFITPSLTNPRKTFNEAKMLDLVESIKASGVHQPILVRPLPAARLEDTFRNRGDGNPLPTHEIVSGERRYRASKLAQQKTIPAMIRALSDAAVLEIQIVENLQRDDLTELEEAEGYQRLCDETGIAKEQVGERIGKSRSYVYGRMKLLDLTVAPREALRKGDIDASRALLIARIPDEKLQLDALGAATEKDYQGSPRLSYRAFQTWVQQNVMLKLASAIFPIADATLLPGAGACPACPKRTGAAPDLFADVDGPDVCTDPKCFHSKEEAHRASLVAIARARGVNIIEGREAKEIKPPGTAVHFMRGYTSLDDQIYVDGERTSLRDLLSDKERKKQVELLVDPDGGELIEIVSDEVAGNAKARAEQARMTPARRKEEEKVQTERAESDERDRLTMEYQKRWRTVAVEQIRPRIEAGEVKALTANLMRILMFELCGVEQRTTEDDAANALGLDEWDDDLLESTVRSTDDLEIGNKVLVALLLADDTPGYIWTKTGREVRTEAPTLEEFASLLSIDLDAIKADVQAQIRAERAPKAPAGAELAAQPEGSAKGEKSKSKPAALARKGKTTKEEASASIAAALQELEAGPGAGAAPSLAVGVAVRFKEGLKSAGGKARKVSGRAGTIDAASGDGWTVRFGPKAHEVAVATSEELELVVDEKPLPPSALTPLSAWPFPKGVQ